MKQPPPSYTAEIVVTPDKPMSLKSLRVALQTLVGVGGGGYLKTRVRRVKATKD